MRTLPPELAAKVKEVRTWMLDGDLDKVAARARKSKIYVSRVMNGHRFNAKILEEAIKVMQENKARFDCAHVYH